MWFDSWSPVLRILLIGAATYGSLLVLLRVSGKRTLAKLNAFDLVATVALGSTLATVLLDDSVVWAEGVAALGTLIALQLVVALVSSRLPGGRALLTSRPTLLLRDGRIDEAAARRARIAVVEIHQAVRSSGQGDLSAVAAVVLETDGSLSVVPRSSAGDLSALGEGVDGVPHEPNT